MSLTIGGFVALGLLAGLVSTLVAITSPRFRVAASIFACLAFAIAGGGVTLFVLIVSSMN